MFKNYTIIELPYQDIDYGIIFSVSDGEYKGVVIHIGEMLMDNERLHYLWKIVDIENEELKEKEFNNEAIQEIVDKVIIDVLNLIAAG